MSYKLIKKVEKGEKIFDNEYIFLIVMEDKKGEGKIYFENYLKEKIQEKIEKVQKSVQEDENIADFSVYFFFISDENKEKLTKIIKKVLKEFGKRAKLLTFKYDNFFEKVLSADEIKLLKKKKEELKCNEPGELLDKFEKESLEITQINLENNIKNIENKGRMILIKKLMNNQLN